MTQHFSIRRIIRHQAIGCFALILAMIFGWCSSFQSTYAQEQQLGEFGHLIPNDTFWFFRINPREFTQHQVASDEKSTISKFCERYGLPIEQVNEIIVFRFADNAAGICRLNSPVDMTDYYATNDDVSFVEDTVGELDCWTVGEYWCAYLLSENVVLNGSREFFMSLESGPSLPDEKIIDYAELKFEKTCLSFTYIDKKGADPESLDRWSVIGEQFNVPNFPDLMKMCSRMDFQLSSDKKKRLELIVEFKQASDADTFSAQIQKLIVDSQANKRGPVGNVGSVIFRNLTLDREKDKVHIHGDLEEHFDTIAKIGVDYHLGRLRDSRSVDKYSEHEGGVEVD